MVWIAQQNLVVLLLLLCFTSQATEDTATIYQLHWQHNFSAADQAKIANWLAQTSEVTTTLLGPYPFTMQYFLYRRQAAEPVPWANTWRDGTQQIHFYLNPDFSLEQFLHDWTAYHEISHLALPFLGKQHAWFAEGFASYMQYQVMQQAGFIGNATEAITAKFVAQQAQYDGRKSLRDNATQLFAQRRYAAGYWAGAQFFVVADRLLRAQQKPDLTTLIKQYQQCCRLRDNTLTDVINSLDKLSNSALFSELLQRFSEQPFADFVSDFPL